jgi:hypothetical protein
MLMLDKRGAVLATAREVTSLTAAAKIDACVIGGVAVVLHGHVRTTKDVDVYCEDLAAVRDVLIEVGWAWNAERREFQLGDVPVQLVDSRVADAPRAAVELEGVRVASLADLITMKLRSGLRKIVRARDIADVIGLISDRGLRKTFAGRLGADVRDEFRRLVDAVERDG